MADLSPALLRAYDLTAQAIDLAEQASRERDTAIASLQAACAELASAVNVIVALRAENADLLARLTLTDQE